MKNLDLTEILKGCEGITLYHTIYGNVVLKKIDNSNNVNYPIILTIKDNSDQKFIFCISKDGKENIDFDGECILFPSKDQRDWSKFERPIPVDTPMMCSNNGIDWFLRYYKKYENKKHCVVMDGFKSNSLRYGIAFSKIIPFDKFDPNNIEESLKFNIQK